MMEETIHMFVKKWNGKGSQYVLHGERKALEDFETALERFIDKTIRRRKKQ